MEPSFTHNDIGGYMHYFRRNYRFILCVNGCVAVRRYLAPPNDANDASYGFGRRIRFNDVCCSACQFATDLTFHREIFALCPLNASKIVLEILCLRAHGLSVVVVSCFPSHRLG